MTALTVFSPAKINLFLSITGRRADGFHDLVSVAATLDFGDSLTVALSETGDFSLRCDQPEVPIDDTNLILRAARAWRDAAPADLRRRGAAFFLEKKTPMGAGLGGGSSNAVAALCALDQLFGHTTSPETLTQIAASLGSDCPLFLDGVPLVMRGRGESLTRLPVGAAARLSGRRLLLFKPSFGISTVWAYRQMAAGAPETYLDADATEKRLAAWISDERAEAEQLLFNNMERPAFRKFLALPTLLAQLRSEFGVAVGMSGSGSACYALLHERTPVQELRTRIRNAWGEEAFITEAKIR